MAAPSPPHARALFVKLSGAQDELDAVIDEHRALVEAARGSRGAAIPVGDLLAYARRVSYYTAPPLGWQAGRDQVLVPFHPPAPQDTRMKAGILGQIHGGGARGSEVSEASAAAAAAAEEPAQDTGGARASRKRQRDDGAGAGGGGGAGSNGVTASEERRAKRSSIGSRAGDQDDAPPPPDSPPPPPPEEEEARPAAKAPAAQLDLLDSSDED